MDPQADLKTYSSVAIALASGGTRKNPSEAAYSGRVHSSKFRNRPARKIAAINNSGVSIYRNTPESLLAMTFSLELEASSQLYLALTEKGAVGTGDGIETAGSATKVQ